MSRLPLIFTCEHATNALPPGYEGRLPKRLLESHSGYDSGSLALAKALSASFDAPLFAGSVSRLVIDLNRSVHHPRLVSQHLSLGAAEREQLLQRYYLPFRQSTVEGVRDTIRLTQPVLHVSVHSFTRKLAGVVRTADIGLLYDPARPGEKRLAKLWRDEIALSSRRVRCNYPYRGTSDGHTTALRRQFSADQYLGLELEVCNDQLTEGRAEETTRLVIASFSACLEHWPG